MTYKSTNIQQDGVKVQLTLHTNNNNRLIMNNTTISGTNHIATILGETLYAIGYFGLSLLIMLLIIWVFLLIQFIWENQKKIQRLMKTNENYQTLVCEKIVAAKSDIVKLRLMIVVIVFELLTCIGLILGLIGDQISIETKIRIETGNKCIPLATKLKYSLINDTTATQVLILCLGGSLTSLSLYLVKAFSNQSEKTHVIKYMTIFTIAQIAITTPLDLIVATSFLEAYLYAIFNTVNYILILRGCLKLSKLLKWRSQDYNFTRHKANMEMIEYRYKRQMYLFLFFYGLVIITMNINLIFRDGLILPSLSLCDKKTRHNRPIHSKYSMGNVHVYPIHSCASQHCQDENEETKVHKIPRRISL